MNDKEKWEELQERLEKAAIEVNVLAVENKIESEATRLFGKREGISVALAYMKELDS